MRELFDRLIAEGEAGIDRLIEEATQETLQLDFKRKEVDRHGEFSTNDRQILAQALSGFANSAGGLIIFGVNARKGQDQIDCAQSAHPISDIRRFLSEANTEVGRLVQPRLDGVVVEAIPSQRVQSGGYLLVYVPRSERRPHRSEARSQKGYYKRVGDSFFEMEHYDIEDSFRRQSTPELIIEVSDRGWANMMGTREQQIGIHLRNVSDNIAKYPYIVLRDFVGVTAPYATVNPSRIHLEVDQGAFNLSAGQDVVIHPGQSRLIAQLKCELVQMNGYWLCNGRPILANDVSFGYRFGCEGARFVEGRYVVPISGMVP